MTPQEIFEALESIRRTVGPRARVAVSITNEAKCVSASCYPEGLMSSYHIYVTGADFEESIEKLRGIVNERLVEIHRQERRKMALLIMQKTLEFGVCTDAALRGEGFCQEQIDLLGQEACAEAESLAAGGPFFIMPGDKANDNL